MLDSTIKIFAKSVNSVIEQNKSVQIYFNDFNDTIHIVELPIRNNEKLIKHELNGNVIWNFGNKSIQILELLVNPDDESDKVIVTHFFKDVIVDYDFMSTRI